MALAATWRQNLYFYGLDNHPPCVITRRTLHGASLTDPIATVVLAASRGGFPRRVTLRVLQYNPPVAGRHPTPSSLPTRAVNRGRRRGYPEGPRARQPCRPAPRPTCFRFRTAAAAALRPGGTAAAFWRRHGRTTAASPAGSLTRRSLTPHSKSVGCSAPAARLRERGGGPAAADSKPRSRSRARSITPSGTPASRATCTPQLLSAAPGTT